VFSSGYSPSAWHENNSVVLLMAKWWRVIFVVPAIFQIPRLIFFNWFLKFDTPQYYFHKAEEKKPKFNETQDGIIDPDFFTDDLWEQSRSSLMNFYNEKDVGGIHMYLWKEYKYKNSEVKVSIRGLCSKIYRRQLSIGVFVNCLREFTNPYLISSILSNYKARNPDEFQKIGHWLVFWLLPGMYWQLTLTVVTFIGLGICIFMTIKFGRKSTMIVSLVGQTASFCVFMICD
jgi:hypothetical protein